jgi:hypothetical protein
VWAAAGQPAHPCCTLLTLRACCWPAQCSFFEHREYKVVYRRYASLFFMVGVDEDEVSSRGKRGAWCSTGGVVSGSLSVVQLKMVSSRQPLYQAYVSLLAPAPHLPAVHQPQRLHHATCSLHSATCQLKTQHAGMDQPGYGCKARAAPWRSAPPHHAPFQPATCLQQGPSMRCMAGHGAVCRWNALHTCWQRTPCNVIAGGTAECAVGMNAGVQECQPCVGVAQLALSRTGPA